MTDVFKGLVESYNSTSNEAVRGIIYDAMMRYTKEYHPGYVCYDMDMYVALYKYATTPAQRKYVLNHICSIIDDDFIGEDELVSNFKEFAPVMKDFLHKDDVFEFDALCTIELSFFMNLLEESKNPKRHHVIPPLPVDVVEGYLKEVAEAVLSTNMKDLESYEMALKILS